MLARRLDITATRRSLRSSSVLSERPDCMATAESGAAYMPNTIAARAVSRETKRPDPVSANRTCETPLTSRARASASAGVNRGKLVPGSLTPSTVTVVFGAISMNCKSVVVAICFAGKAFDAVAER